MQLSGANRIGVIVNPRAGRAPAARQWRPLVPGAAVVETALPAAIRPALEEFREAGIKLLVVAGGDGTLSKCLTAAQQIWGDADLPAVLPAPCGTINMVVRQLGWHQPGNKIANWLCSACDTGHPIRLRSVRTLRAQDGSLGFTAGFGVPARFLQAYADAGPGRVNAVRQLARFSLSGVQGGRAAKALFAPLGLRWGESAPDQRAVWTVGLIMRIDALPLGFRVTPGASRDEQLHLLAGAPSALQVLRALPALRHGGSLRQSGLARSRHRQLNLVFDEPTAWMMDGELYPPVRQLKLSDGPLLQLAVPA